MTLHELQAALIAKNLDAYIVSRNNMFLGQDVLPAENKIQELTNFSGSAGTLLVFRNKALLFVDGRYELQAALEVDSSNVEVICTKESLAAWIQNNLHDPCKIAYNPWCHSISEVDYWSRALKRHTFIDDKWQLLGSRLAVAEPEIFELKPQFSGITMDEKISYLTAFMRDKQLDAFFISEADCVSWLTNLRSHTLSDTPLLRAFALVNAQGEISLFTNDFNQIEVELAKYKGQSIGLAFGQTPKQLQNIMKDHKIWLNNMTNPIQMWKAVKNPVEIAGFKQAHLRDAAAVVNFLYWLEHHWSNQTELSVVDRLYEFRKGGQNFYGNSFETIAAFNANGAIVHYQPHAATDLPLAPGGVLLLDSGAQYYDGTTDITRTIAIGRNQSPAIIDSFTQVLKAHIAAASTLFPAGTVGSAIDAVCRSQLWRFGKDYNHGTGHGVGHFLNVHEGPFSLSSRSSSAPLAAGMITSIEPGYYQADAYGIRIENLNLIENTLAANNQTMLKFTPLTLVPIDKRLINKYLLTAQEITWLNDYHRLVWQQIAPLINDDVKDWLQEACAPLD